MEVGDLPLKDKVVLVTGGGSGICAAFCKRAADIGAKVVIGDLRLGDDAQKLVDDNSDVVFQKTDVSKRAELESLVALAKEKFGLTPDVYIGGAGIFEPEWSSFWHDTEEDGYINVDINLNHPLKLTRIGMHHLVSEDRKGVIVPIASVGGIAGGYHVPLYIATKHGIVGFVKSMKLAEKYEGIKIVTICPGAVDTPLWTQERRDRVGFENVEKLSADNVAEAMIDLVQEGKYPGGTCLEIMPNDGPKTRVLPEWNIDPPQGGSTTKYDPESKDVPPAFREAKGVMDKERGSAKK